MPIAGIISRNGGRKLGQTQATISDADLLIEGKSCLSVDWQIYSFTENQKDSVAATVSLKNISQSDTLCVVKAVFFTELDRN